MWSMCGRSQRHSADERATYSGFVDARDEGLGAGSAASAQLTLEDLRTELRHVAEDMPAAVAEKVLQGIATSQTKPAFGSSFGSFSSLHRTKSLVSVAATDGALQKKAQQSNILNGNGDNSRRRSSFTSVFRTQTAESIRFADDEDEEKGEEKDGNTMPKIVSRASGVSTAPPSEIGGDSMNRAVQDSKYAALMRRSKRFSSFEVQSFQDVAKRIVTSTYFDQAMALTVVANTVSVGISTDIWARNHTEDSSGELLKLIDKFSLFVFTLEWLLRLAAYRGELFTVEGGAWNIFDTMMLAGQSFMQVMTQFSHAHVVSVGALRTLRLLRIIRVFDDMRVIVSSIFRATTSLCWAVVLLVMMIYVFAILLMQIILHSGKLDESPKIAYWFSNVLRTCLTLFQSIVGGLSWNEAVEPLISHIGPWVAALYCLYVGIALFAMMNIMTGVFCDQAMRVVREDKDKAMAQRIADLFESNEEDPDDDGETTWAQFRDKLKCATMEDYFRQINVDLSEARKLFELLDADGSGSLDNREMVDGCLRLRGPARALDLAYIAKDVSEICEVIQSQSNMINEILTKIKPRGDLDTKRRPVAM
eukprot:TRINITY_DN328_c0_g2_i1.p1 TRINITY_DN328_c0_g2~~TRINITY_DN328_c0_g2_i1.p1  ORF type:complete len:590 (+),score=156.99 TRINITY_DN328_c0_g2_i1:99-1868(+)